MISRPNEPTKVSNERYFEKQRQRRIVKFYHFPLEIQKIPKVWEGTRRVSHRKHGKSKQHQTSKLTPYAERQQSNAFKTLRLNCFNTGF